MNVLKSILSVACCRQPLKRAPRFQLSYRKFE